MEGPDAGLEPQAVATPTAPAAPNALTPAASLPNDRLDIPFMAWKYPKQQMLGIGVSGATSTRVRAQGPKLATCGHHLRLLDRSQLFLVGKVATMAAVEKFRIDLEALAHSAAQVSGQGEDLATAHLSSDNRIAAAQSGWVGSSAGALLTKTASWLETSRQLITKVGEHAVELNTDGVNFAGTEDENAEKLRAVRDRAG